MRLTEIRTVKLFGIFDHVVPLNMEERITIIHGPNGYGKTAILRLISAFFNRRFSTLFQLPFEEILFKFDKCEPVAIKKRLEHERKTNHKRRRRDAIIIEIAGHEPFDLARSMPVDFDDVPPEAITHYIPFLTRIGPLEWVHDHTGEQLTLDDILIRFPENLPHSQRHAAEFPAWLQSIIDSLEVHYIQAQRLETIERRTAPRRERFSNPTAAVNAYAEDLAGEMQSTLRKYGELSQSLDRSFPHRLVTDALKPQLSIGELRERLIHLEDRQKKLTDVGLLDKEGYPFYAVPSIDESKIDALSIYVDDAARKLSVFDDLYSRIGLFQKLINKRFLFKTMSLDKQEGFVFRTRLGEPLPATSLSTGEQHELVLLYELLFRVKRDSLILVDEPEISLHIAWQEQFLKDLKDITELSNFDVLIATHSPQIISDRWDLTVPLKSPEGNAM